MKILSVTGLIFALLSSMASAAIVAQAPLVSIDTHDVYFNSISKLCGKAFVGKVVSNNAGIWVCVTAHTSAAADEPGVGASWPNQWDQVEQATEWVAEQQFSFEVLVPGIVASDFLTWRASDGNGDSGANIQASVAPLLVTVIV